MGTKESEKVTEHVATETVTSAPQVETVPNSQNTPHVEMSPPAETAINPLASLQTEALGTPTEHSTNGIKEADSTMEVVKVTSMQNLESPKTPVTYLDDEVKTDAYSDDDTIPDIDNVTQIPVANAQVVDTVNEVVESSTDLNTPCK